MNKSHGINENPKQILADQVFVTEEAVSVLTISVISSLPIKQLARRRFLENIIQ